MYYRSSIMITGHYLLYYRSMFVIIIMITDHYLLYHRSMFVPYPGAVLVAADYSQLELRLIAQLSKDKNLR